MRFNGLRWPLLLAVSISAGLGAAKTWAADNEKSKFEVRPAAAYAHHQTSEKVTIAVEPMETDEQTREAFGKVNPFRYGVLPVPIVIQNDGPDLPNQTGTGEIRLHPARMGNRRKPRLAQDVRFIHGTKAPKEIPTPIGIKVKRPPKEPSGGVGRSKDERLRQKCCPPVSPPACFPCISSVDQTSAAALVDISGLANPVTGKELYYFEIPLSGR